MDEVSTPRPEPLVMKQSDGGMVLSEAGKKIVSAGGADGISDDTMVMLEVISRAPGMNEQDLALCCVNLRMEYGEDALLAIKNGHVKFEKRN